MAVEVVTGPAIEPVTLAEAKTHLRVDIDADDSLITAQIASAREWAERYTRRALISQTWRRWADEFGDAIILQGGKVASVTSVKYIDNDGTLQTLDPAVYKLASPGHDEIAFLEPAYGQSWPSTRDESNAVQIEYVVGYGALAADVPQTIRSVIKLHVGWHYEHREPKNFGIAPGGLFDQLEHALERMLSHHRLYTLT